MQHRRFGAQSAGSPENDDKDPSDLRRGVRKALRRLALGVTATRRGGGSAVVLVIFMAALFAVVVFLTASKAPSLPSRPPGAAFLRRRGADLERSQGDDLAAGGSAAAAALTRAPAGDVSPGAAGEDAPQVGAEGSQPEAEGAEFEGLRGFRGVAASDQSRYSEMQAAGHFECFDGSQRFDRFGAVVNDDYCDCPDGSDEPGTSACAHLAKLPRGPELPGFSCGWNLDPARLAEHPARARVVHRSAVNDGICDCCAGEDEWSGDVVCEDRCSEVEAEASEQASLAMAGSRARAEYVQKAQALKAQARFRDVDGGPDDVFLGQGCLSLDDGDYIYEVCLFDHVTQKGKHGQRSFKLGRKGKWSSTLWENGQQRKDYSKLIMGDGEHCAAAHGPRRAEIHFECSPDASIASVQETQTCVYTVRMLTPAACPALPHGKR